MHDASPLVLVVPDVGGRSAGGLFNLLVTCGIEGESSRPRAVVGGPDGLIIDEHDNIWIACNQSNEIMVLEPRQGRVIAKLGDFGGIGKDGAPIGFLWSNSLVFHGDDVLVTNLSLDIGALRPTLRTVDGPWAAQVKLHTVSKIKKHIPSIPK